ncbi:MAG: HAD hydrolase-like protein [Deltaproteobacteria bacterium]|nr:HAD hydrolase-like protein [Deltaproteobacteria bacterium]
MSKIRHVIWDWNGTLLDDVDVCVSVLNDLLKVRGLPNVTRDLYKRRFGFPVRPFYADLGFDVSEGAFEDLSHEFIGAYKIALHAVQLHKGALDVMADLADHLDGQFVISAMEHNMLGLMLNDYGVMPLLRDHQGTSNLQAGSKVEVGVTKMQALGLRGEELLLVGDTEHDLELARALGCACVLHAGGHQSRERLALTGCPVVDDLEGVLSVVRG